MRKLTIDQLFKAGKRNLALILLPAILLFALVFGQSVLKGPSFEATSILMVEAVDEGEISYNKIILNEKLANIYGQFLESKDLYDKVADKLRSSLDGEDIKSSFAYQMNPQAGVFTLSYQDEDYNRAYDALSLISEEFRAYVREFLKVDNLSYLQEVKVDESSKLKAYIFSILAFFVGLILGLILTILKEILSDKIRSAKDIEDLGFRVFDYKDEGLIKVKVAINNLTDNSIIGITSMAKEDTFAFSQDLALLMAKSLGVFLVDPRGGSKIDGKYESSKEDIKILRYRGIDLIKPKASEEDFLDSYQFEDKIFDLKTSYNYILIDEGYIGDCLASIGLKYEDYKIILANKDLKKNDLIKKARQIEDLGSKVLGVVYYQ